MRVFLKIVLMFVKETADAGKVNMSYMNIRAKTVSLPDAKSEPNLIMKGHLK
jgi:hypothetical protein